jgi:hypothetical protein
MPNFYQWLAQQGKLHVLETASDAELKALRLEYRKAYKAEYNKKYRQEKIHRIIIYSYSDYEFLKKIADKYGKSFSGMVRESSLAYHRQEFILPSPEQTKQILVAFSKYGTNLNQLSHNANISKSIYNDQIKHIQNNFNELSRKVSRIYQQPFKLDEVLAKTLEKNPSYIEQIKPIIHPYYD